MDKALWTYLLIINVLAFALYGLDKYCAVRHKWRISERNLLLVAFVGGSLGAYAAMHIFRHKTKHRKFTVIVPLFIVLHIAVIVWIML